MKIGRSRCSASFYMKECGFGNANFILIGVAVSQRIAQDIASSHAKHRHVQAHVFVGTRTQWTDRAGNYIAEPTVVRQQ
jgi:hypothetical protein